MGHRVTLDEQMLVSAVRYALGRSSYVVGSTIGAVRGAWSELSESARAVIIRDIREALERAGEQSRTVGMSVDNREWEQLLSYVQFGEDEHGPDEGYPSTEELHAIRTFRGSARELTEYVQSIWRNGAGTTIEQYEDRWGRTHHVVTLVTGGWSGCEDVVGALTGTLAIMYASEWSKGGRWKFDFPAFVWDVEEPWDWALRQEDESTTSRQLTDIRDRLAHLERQTIDHDIYLRSMMGVEHPDPSEDCYVSASFDLYSRMHVSQQFPEHTELL